MVRGGRGASPLELTVCAIGDAADPSQCFTRPRKHLFRLVDAGRHLPEEQTTDHLPELGEVTLTEALTEERERSFGERERGRRIPPRLRDEARVPACLPECPRLAENLGR